MDIHVKPFPDKTISGSWVQDKELGYAEEDDVSTARPNDLEYYDQIPFFTSLVLRLIAGVQAGVKCPTPMGSHSLITYSHEISVMNPKVEVDLNFKHLFNKALKSRLILDQPV